MARQIIFSLFLLIGLVATLRGQTPTSTFEELRTRKSIKEGDTVTLTEGNGTTYKARIAQLADKLSVVTTNGVRRDLMESQVREITRRRHDPLWNGLLIGTGIGLAGGIFAGTGESCESGKCTASSVLVFSGIGAGIGAVVDFAIRKHETVYLNSQITRSLRISPIFDKKVRGATASISF